jgi:ABC-type transport system involved in multi-copper enzyme maturation permease subunit
MKNAFVIAAREFEEKRFVVYAALAFAVLPFVLAAIPGITNGPRRDVIAVAAVIMSTGFTLGLAAITGASFVGRDLSDGRMSFYFSRPSGSMSIWFGKLMAGLVLVAGCFGLILVPALLAARENLQHTISTSLGDATAIVLVAALGLFLIAHVLGTFTRSRSPVVAFDFAAAVLCGLAIRYLIVPLLAGQALLVVRWLTIALSTALVIAIAGGGAWQLERGRTDRRRNHVALSQFLWGTMAVALLIAAAYVAWVVSAKLQDLGGDARAVRATGGPFAVVTGTANGRGDYRAGFLLNTDDGSATRIDPRVEWEVQFTRDGRSAIVPRPERDFANLLVYRAGWEEPVDTGLTVSSGSVIASDDGGRIATISNQGILSIYDVAQKRSLASARLPEAHSVRGFFVSPDVIRLYLNTAAGLQMAELDVRTRGLRQTGLIASTTFVLVFVDPSASHMLVRKAREDVVTLNDARTGAAITTLLNGTQLKMMHFLRDGRIVIVDGPQSATTLHILSASGAPQKDVPVGPSSWSRFIGDDGTRVVISPTDPSRHASLIAVNINRGLIERRETEAGSASSFELRPPIQPLRDVFFNNRKGIVAWNPATGAKRMVTGG